MDVSNSDDNTSMREVFSSPLNRRLLLGGWSAAVGATLVNAALNSRDERRSSLTRRRNLFKSITEDVREFRSILEIGIGGDTGLGSFANLEFFRPGQRIVGIDPALSEGTSRKLEKASQQAFKRGIELEGIGGVAEELPFESGTFDAVVSTMVFCTVRDPDKALREVSRVLRPGGKFVFIEHVLAPEEGWLGLRHQQELFDPLQQILASGCHLTRETGQLVKAAASGSPSRRAIGTRDELLRIISKERMLRQQIKQEMDRLQEEKSTTTSTASRRARDEFQGICRGGEDVAQRARDVRGRTDEDYSLELDHLELEHDLLKGDVVPDLEGKLVDARRNQSTR